MKTFQTETDDTKYNVRRKNNNAGSCCKNTTSCHRKDCWDNFPTHSGSPARQSAHCLTSFQDRTIKCFKKTNLKWLCWLHPLSKALLCIWTPGITDIRGVCKHDDTLSVSLLWKFLRGNESSCFLSSVGMRHVLHEHSRSKDSDSYVPLRSGI